MDDYDLILCGKQTTDGDTAQVGAELAELLDIPHASNVTMIEPDGEGGIKVRISRDDSIVTQYMPLPCLLCMDGDINTPRLPSFKRKKALSGNLIQLLNLDDLKDKDESLYGIKGSPTQVEAIFPPAKSSGQELFTDSGDILGKKLAEILISKKMIVKGK